MTQEQFLSDFNKALSGKLGPNGGYAKVLYKNIEMPTMANATSVLNIIEAEKSGSYAAIMVEMKRLKLATRQ